MDTVFEEMADNALADVYGKDKQKVTWKTDLLNELVSLHGERERRKSDGIALNTEINELSAELLKSRVAEIMIINIFGDKKTPAMFKSRLRKYMHDNGVYIDIIKERPTLTLVTRKKFTLK